MSPPTTNHRESIVSVHSPSSPEGVWSVRTTDSAAPVTTVRSDLTPARPTPLEVSSGVVVGSLPPASAPSPASSAGSPLVALEAAILPALQRAPCLVSFSGGLDSSFILAVACRLARRHGLPLPIPTTWRFSGAPLADESSWQERVVSSLALTDWVRLRAGDGLDLVGPVAQRVLLRHGLLHPVNVHLHQPIVELAGGGSVLTGAGGDQILSGWQRRDGRGPRRLYDGLPAPVQAWVRHRRGHDPLPWLDHRVSRHLLAAHLRERRAQPRDLCRRVAWHAARRDLGLTTAALRTLAADSDVEVVNPLLDPAFHAALVVSFRAGPVPSRTELLAAIAGGAVAAACIEPRPKARFLDVFFRAPTRDLVSAWDGSGVDPDVVDVARLKALWSSWPIPPGTAGLVQQVWLAGQPGDGVGSPLVEAAGSDTARLDAASRGAARDHAGREDVR